MSLEGKDEDGTCFVKTNSWYRTGTLEIQGSDKIMEFQNAAEIR
jgi:hypothetical protein